MINLHHLGLHGPEPAVERIDVAQPLDLATGRYQDWREEAGVPIGITVGRPRFVRYRYIQIQALAPWELMRPPLKGIDDIPIERRVYRQRLTRHEAEILAALREVARSYPTLPGVLLCYEKVNQGEACHRRWAAEWFLERYGWEVPELPDPQSATAPRARKPKMPEPPTLF
ncbi:DUF488 family protein [Streptomyces sp. DH12]|uniref:DUF488 family protein n=1 Tax=Streptomyces sp. DH12 TaxID=2857010 RepID=UPI001E414D2F|nr:DUF488 family protein [Streptomyces sp. DH12]